MFLDSMKATRGRTGEDTVLVGKTGEVYNNFVRADVWLGAGGLVTV